MCARVCERARDAVLLKLGSRYFRRGRKGEAGIVGVSPPGESQQSPSRGCVEDGRGVCVAGEGERNQN